MWKVYFNNKSFKKMFANLYAISFSAALVSLICWYIFADNKGLSKLMGTIFTISLIGYLVASYTGTMSVGDRLFQLFRDIAVMAISGWLIGILKSEKPVKGIMIIAALLFLYFFYFNYMKTQYIAHANASASGISLDPDGELLVELKNGYELKSLDKVLKQYGLSTRTAFEPSNPEITDLDDYFVLNIPGKEVRNLAKIIRDLESSGAVDWVEENEMIQLDPMEATAGTATTMRQDFGLNDPGIVQQWGFGPMGIDRLYQLIRTGNIQPQKKSLIAILDTGVDSKHEDLKGSFRSIKSSSDSDRNSHGTHCAGIAGAVSNNGIGIASFGIDNRFSDVSSVKVLTDGGSGSQESIIDGIIYATDKGADVISMSLGGPSNRISQRAYEQAVQYANKAGAIVVVAAGNSNADARKHTPANAAGVITVSAIDATLKKSAFSNDVSGLTMGIAAPGSNIYSTLPGNKYGALNGTSMATPYVAGLIGMMKSIRPALTTTEAWNILNETGSPTGSGNSTGKLIQPAAAIQKLL